MAKYALEMEILPEAEIVHHASNLGVITSNFATIRCEHASGNTQTFKLRQRGWKNLAMAFRLLRRLLRLDKIVVTPVETDGHWIALIAIRDGRCYHIDLNTEIVTETLRLRQSRNPLHQSICVSDSGNYFQGEYGSNPDRATVPVYRSVNQGLSWDLVYEFPAGKARHIHGCFWDPFERKVWVCTGDFKNENHLLVADEEFKELEWLGDGTQSWRTCHLLFTRETVYWGMDSQLETSYICKLDRATRKMEKIVSLPGPIWYAKALVDGWFLAASAVENGPGVHDDHSHIFISNDGETWHDVYRAKKDFWKMPHFKNGVINFAEGDQGADGFFLSAEGLESIDGRVHRVKIVKL